MRIQNKGQRRCLKNRDMHGRLFVHVLALDVGGVSAFLVLPILHRLGFFGAEFLFGVQLGVGTLGTLLTLTGGKQQNQPR